MIGDKIEIKPAYLKIATKIVEHIYQYQSAIKPAKYVINIAGESGSGKSVTALCIQHLLQQRLVKAVVLHQDDYFYLPPATNHTARQKNLTHVGMQEVDMMQLQLHIQQFLNGDISITQPLINYTQNTIGTQLLDVHAAQVLIVEGTYALHLQDALHKIFMSRTYLDTITQRKDRGREAQSDFIEKVLEIEHHIIKNQISKADLIVLKDYSLQTIL
jgi:uridine kinase